MIERLDGLRESLHQGPVNFFFDRRVAFQEAIRCPAALPAFPHRAPAGTVRPFTLRFRAFPSK